MSVVAVVRVLVVCTGNICRSPMAEVLLGAQLADAGVAAEVTSAGILYDGRPASTGAVAAMASLGLDLSGHASRTLTRDMIAAADLVIGMEPRHVREVVALHDPAWTKTFTLRELARRAESGPVRSSDEPLRTWLEGLGTGRRRLDLLGDEAALSVLDPYRQDQSVYDATAADLAGELRLLVSHAWPPTTAEHAPLGGLPHRKVAQVRRVG